MFKRRKLFVFTVLFDWVQKKWQKWNKFLKNGQTNISISELITKEGMEDFSPPPPASPYSVAYTNALWSLFKTFSHANVGHSSKKSLMLPTNPNRNSYAFCICWKPQHKLPSSQSCSWMTLKVRWWKEQISSKFNLSLANIADFSCTFAKLPTKTNSSSRRKL